MHSIQRVAVLLVVFMLVTVSLARAQGDAKKNASYPQLVFIIRHAEKTGKKNDLQLSKKGIERANVVFQMFETSKNRPSPFPTPDFIFAASNSTSSHRPLQTVIPLAMRLRLPIDYTYASKRSSTPDKDAGKEKFPKTDDMLGLRAELFGNSNYRGKTILVSWRHSTIPELAKTLGAKKAPEKWEGTVFDRVWQLSYDDYGNVAFLDRPQRLLPGDAED